MQNYPIGTPNVVWNESDKLAWFNRQTVKRSYFDEVISKLRDVDGLFIAKQYGYLPIDEKRYPLYVFTSTQWDKAKPSVLITGGVHGYETSGVQGAIAFLLEDAQKYQDRFNFIVAPCISPWGYETINRWTYNTIDPNRSFYTKSPSPEAEQIMVFVKSFLESGENESKLLAHFDLHETTDTDNSEFRPALGARDGIILDEWDVPDGFYTVADTSKPELEFQNAVIAAVKEVTHIAPSDVNQQIIGSDEVSPGVICYDKSALFLCGGFTNATYVTTTEVYPDSANASPQSCIDAQVAAITGGLDYLIQSL